MILSNYWKWLDVATTHATPYRDAPAVFVGLTLLDGKKLTSPIETAVQYQIASFVSTSLSSSIILRFGTGEHDLTPEDYCLAEDITNYFTDVRMSIQSSTEELNFVRTFTVSGLNLTELTQTITEVGITKGISSKWDYDQRFMLAIVKLDTPIEVPPQESFTAVINWVEG